MRPVRRQSGCTLFRMAADTGSELGQLYLGAMYERGWQGVPPDEAQAYVWYRKASDQGNVEAHFAIRQLYERGWNGVASNPWEAGRYYRKAADLRELWAVERGVQRTQPRRSRGRNSAFYLRRHR